MIANFLLSAAISTALYYYLHLKTHISLKFLYIDNLAVILLISLLSFYLKSLLFPNSQIINYVLIPFLIMGLAFIFTMIRFWRTPKRKIRANLDEIVSPADGNVIYITKVEANSMPISIKGNTYSKLHELSKTDILDQPCILIGINMTPFDVHKNCAPIDGKIILNQHYNGRFLSLKDKAALIDNERNTYVIQGQYYKVGVIQIASKLVRRIDTYVETGDLVKRGDWLGMIRFGSQVDVIVPIEFDISVHIKDQVYAGESIIAVKKKQ
jgi:phosphatidylserine decarboxylase